MFPEYIIILFESLILRDAYQGALSEEEMAALKQAAREKSTALELIEAREREIRHIRDGRITSKIVRISFIWHVQVTFNCAHLLTLGTFKQ